MTTSDADFVRRVWLPLDFDPVRPAGISSTDAEFDAARVWMLGAVAWLEGELPDRPAIWAFLGDGYHAL